MKKSFLILTALVFSCFISNIALADIYYTDLDGGDIIGLSVYIDNEWVYEDEAYIGHGPIYPVPPHDEVFDGLSYNENDISVSVSTLYGFTREENGFTINLHIDGWGTHREDVRYKYNVQTELGTGWVIHDLKLGEKVLMKVEIIGSNPDYLYCQDYNLNQPLAFDYDGIYYIAYLTEGSYRMIPGMDTGWLTNTDISRNCQINCTFEVVPVPGAALLGLIGLTISGLKLRRKNA